MVFMTGQPDSCLNERRSVSQQDKYISYIMNHSVSLCLHTAIAEATHHVAHYPADELMVDRAQFELTKDINIDSKL